MNDSKEWAFESASYLTQQRNRSKCWPYILIHLSVTFMDAIEWLLFIITIIRLKFQGDRMVIVLFILFILIFTKIFTYFIYFEVYGNKNTT